MNKSYQRLSFVLALLGSTLNSAAYTAAGSRGIMAHEVLQNDGSRTGAVKDSKGEPIIGASIVIKGQKQGVTTDVNGHFTLPKLQIGDIVRVSYVGCIPQEVKYEGQPLNITLEENSKSLDELVVVGYGTQRKESLTGSLQTIKGDKLEDVTTPQVSNMLNGKISGVYVAPGSSQPGQDGAVMIRGKATLSGTSAPLWVIDGVIVGSSAGSLNPNDIATMTILKDAASTAIYGSQGANGVIVITTKSGQGNSLKINASAKWGISRLTNGKLEMMDGTELYDYYKSFQNVDQISFPRWNADLRNSNFDWWKLATHSGFTQDYNVSLSGGSDKIKSYMSLGYYDESGAVKGYDYGRYNFRLKMNYHPYSWLTIKPYVAGARTKVHDAQYSVDAMYSMLPWDSPYDKDGNLVPDRYSGWVNNAATNYLNGLSYGNYTDYTTYEFMGNFDFDIHFTPWLTFSSVNNYKWQGYYYHSYGDPRDTDYSGVHGRISEYQSNMVRRYTNQILRFNKVFGKHVVNALAAYEFNDYLSKAINAQGTGFVPGFQVLDVTAVPEKVGGSLSEWAVQSYLFNANYSYDDRYFGQLSFRRDGASNFGNNARYGNFFSISGGWIINHEKWFKAKWVDLLKLRASYGSVGNRPYSLYPQYDLYSVSGNYNALSSALISQVGNQDLTWEKTYTTGVGLDASFFGNRLYFNVDIYNKYTSNILYRVPVSGLTGITSRWKNVGEMSNKGIELTIGGDIIRTKDWRWNIEMNLSHNSNKIKKLYGNNPELEIIASDGTNIAGGADKILKKGYSSDSFYLVEWAGVDPQTGAPQWYKHTKDANGNITGTEITNKYAEADQVISKASTPKLYGGINTTLSWKNIDMAANFGYSIGGWIYNYIRQEYDSDGAYTDRNQMKLKNGWSRWEKPGDIATHPIASYNNASGSNKASTRYLEKGNYFKLRTLTIGYTVNLPKYYIQSMRLFFTGENLFCLTPYSGVDPELPAAADATTSELAARGTTTTSYPTARKFMFGINLTF